MSGIVPKDRTWCSRCRCPEVYGDGSPCSLHRDADGKAKEYTGEQAYEPSKWVLEAVDATYRSAGVNYICNGYDPRSGFLMVSLADMSVHSVSERAIGSNFHKVLQG